MSQERIVAAGSVKLFLIDGAEHQDGVVTCTFPQVAIEPPEQLDAVVTPGPTKIVGDVSQSFDCRRQRRDHAEGSDAFHDPEILSVPQRPETKEGSFTLPLSPR